MSLTKQFFALAVALLLLLAVTNEALAVSEADIARIKAKVEAGETLTPADLELVKVINATTGSFIDLNAISSMGREGPRPPRDPLDDYIWTEVDYEWVDISQNGTSTNLMGDDQTLGPFNIGFNFPFYGATYSQVWVCTNGWLSFMNPGTAVYWETAIPDPVAPNAACYIWWDDLYVPTSSDVKYYYDQDGDRFIVSWHCRRLGGTVLFNFQIVLTPDGGVRYTYESTDPTNNSCLVGIENEDGTEALQVCFDGTGRCPEPSWAILISQPDGVPGLCRGLAANVSGNNVTLTWEDPTRDTNGNDITIDNVQVWWGLVGSGQLLATVPAGVQTYTHHGVPDGNHTYSLRAYLDPYYGAASTVAGVIVGTPTYNENFDLTDGMWVADPTDGWMWGAPATPIAPHSPPNVWGTGLNGPYPNNACWFLDLNLGLPVVSPTATVEFWWFADVESSWDGVNFKVSVDGGTTWELVTPNGGYTQQSTNAECISGEPSWTGFSTAWVYVVLPVGQYVNQTPIFRLTFGTDASVTYRGFFIDDMIIWGLQTPEFADVSGTISLDGGSGVLTNVTVHADGLGSPNAHPNAQGQYNLDDVLVGNRVLSAVLDGYHTDTLMVNVPAGGLTNQNMTVRRLNPPAPTGLTASVNNATGLVTLDWDNSPDPLVDVYRVYRKLRPDANWVLVQTFGQSGGTDQLPGDGIWQYRVTAVDTNVIAPPVESDPSRLVEALYGHLPPQMLTTNGNFDDRIRLAWLEPGAPPESEIFYDNGTNSPTVDGIGWWGSQPEFGWFGSHFQGNGLIAVTRIKIYYTSFATLGDPIEVGCFADVGGGIPTFEPLGVIDAVHEEPLDSFRIFELAEPVVFDDGSFFIATRQMTSNSICVGGDEETPFINNTFFYCYQIALGWIPFENAPLLAIPMIRAFVIGDMGGGREIELQPAPVRSRSNVQESFGGPQRTVKGLALGGESSKMAGPGDKSVKIQVCTEPMATRSMRAMDGWRMAFLGSRSVAPHASYVMAAPMHRGRRTLDDVIRYLIYRNNNLIDSVGGTVLTYDNVGTIENTDYRYYVKARYDDQVLSPASNEDTARCNMAPGPPTGLAANPQGATQMRLEWTDPTVNRDGTPCVDLAAIKVYRDNAFLANVNPGVHQYVDSPPIPNQFYLWTVTAVDEVPNEGPGISIRGAVQSPWQQVPMEWVDISQNGTSTNLMGDDQTLGPFNIGFNFTFYGNTYTQVWVCTNGWFSFVNPNTSVYWETAIPDPALPNAACYIWWDDLYVPTNQDVKYRYDQAEDRFIVSWHCRRLGGTILFNFQIVLTTNGGVLYNYQSIDPTNNSCTVGVENADGSDAIQLCFDGQGDYLPQANTAVQFWGGPSGRISGVVTSFGTNQPIPSATVYLQGVGDTVTTAPDGTYGMRVDPATYTVCFRHPTYCDTCVANVVVEDNGETTVNMRMRSPTMVPNPTSLTFAVAQGQIGQQPLTISNPTGACALRFTLTDTSAWLSENPAQGTVQVGTPVDVQVSVNTAALQPGDYVSVIRIAYNAPGTPTSVTVDLHVLDAPGIESLPTDFAYYQNYPNPFNAVTALRFDLPRESLVEIAIYNLMGQEVARPVNQVMSAGRHRVLFDGKDLPSGMYVVKMDAGEFHSLGKMLLLK
jgi:hypothetical protein